MEVPIDQVLAGLERHLEPVLGPLMTSAAIRAQCERLGVRGATMEHARIDALVSALAKGTRVFAGAARTREVFEGLTERLIAEAQA